MAQCYLSWESYKKNICNGFSHFQQSEEFVDMTLAAEGHLVKVHKSLLALASPYIKEMLHSAPCPHPVLFLNSVTHEVLCYILEYVYRGEVHVPAEKMPKFVEAAQALHIIGVNNLPSVKQKPNLVPVDKIVIPKRNTATETIQSTNIDLNMDTNVLQEFKYDCVNAFNLEVMNNDQPNTNNQSNNDFDNSILNDVDNEVPVTNLEVLDVEMVKPFEETTDNTNNLENNVHYDEYSIQVNNDQSNTIDMTQPTAGKTQQVYHIDVQLPEEHNDPPRITINAGVIENKAAPQPLLKSLPENVNLNRQSPLYTISTRGTLQMILNRFMYNVHYCSDKGRKKRWRCIDYRLKHCKAFIDTQGDHIINRKFAHSHPFHDEKIMRKGCQKNVFTSMAEAVADLNRLEGVNIKVLESDYEREKSNNNNLN